MPPRGSHDVYRTNSARHSVGKSESAKLGGLESNRHPKLEISFLVNQSQSGSPGSGSGDNAIGRQQSLSARKLGEAKRYRCEMCPSTFAQSHDKSKHYRTVHEKLRPYTCDICQRSFGEKGNLSKHKKSVHLNERPFSCEHCSSSFAFKDGLHRHQSLVHLDHRPFVCKICGASYKQVSQLRKHTLDKHTPGAARRRG